MLQHDGAEGVDDPAPGHRRRAEVRRFWSKCSASVHGILARGKTLAAGVGDRTVRLYDPATGPERLPRLGREWAAPPSPEGKRELKGLGAQRGSRKPRLASRRACVSPDGKLLASGLEDLGYYGGLIDVPPITLGDVAAAREFTGWPASRGSSRRGLAAWAVAGRVGSDSGDPALGAATGREVDNGRDIPMASTRWRSRRPTGPSSPRARPTGWSSSGTRPMAARWASSRAADVRRHGHLGRRPTLLSATRTGRSSGTWCSETAMSHQRQDLHERLSSVRGPRRPDDQLDPERLGHRQRPAARRHETWRMANEPLHDRRPPADRRGTRRGPRLGDRHGQGGGPADPGRADRLVERRLSRPTGDSSPSATLTSLNTDSPTDRSPRPTRPSGSGSWPRGSRSRG